MPRWSKRSAHGGEDLRWSEDHCCMYCPTPCPSPSEWHQTWVCSKCSSSTTTNTSGIDTTEFQKAAAERAKETEKSEKKKAEQLLFKKKKQEQQQANDEKGAGKASKQWTPLEPVLLAEKPMSQRQINANRSDTFGYDTNVSHSQSLSSQPAQVQNFGSSKSQNFNSKKRR